MKHRDNRDIFEIKWLILTTIVLLLVGILLMIFKPSILFITTVHTTVTGVLCLMLAVMFGVCIAYKCLIENK